MHTRTTALAATLFTFFLLHSAFLTNPAAAQAVREPAITGRSEAGPIPVTTTGAAAPTVNREPPTVNPSSTPTPSTADADDDIVTMSVFNVTGLSDDGYSAANSTSGSRVNTPLKDIAASISVFTEEFLDDIGAATIEDMLVHAGNVEFEFEDATNGFNNNDTRMAGSANNRFRVRGIKATTLVDGVQSPVPFDQYNMNRPELASGANSILYGIGAQGGVVLFNTQRASAQRNKTTIKNVIGTWSSPSVSGIPNERFILDYNVVLMPKKMAFRLNALYQNHGSWKYWDYNDAKRLTPSFMVKPFKNTAIYFHYEGGRVQNATTRSTNLQDGYSTWDAAGRPIMEGFGTAYQVAGTEPVKNATNTNPYYVLINNDNNIYNLCNTQYRSTQPGQTMLPTSISPYYYSTVGPGGKRDQKFNDYSLIVEQAIGKFNLQLQYTHNQNDSTATSPGAIRAVLQGDPNASISPAQWTGASGVIPNPYAGRLFSDTNWIRDTNFEKNDALILTTEYSLDFKKWGRHRIINLLGTQTNEKRINRSKEILVDDNQVAINNPNDPLNANNNLFRRNYLTEGDYTTYYDGAYDGPVEYVIGDKTYRSAWASQDNREAHIKATIDSAMLALQSYWFRGKLATIFGGRVDTATFKRRLLDTILTDPNDPRILDKSRVLNDSVLGAWTPTHKLQAYTFSAGGVYHMPWLSNRASLTANYSTNRGLPDLDGRTVYPTGDIAPLSEGRTFDYGVRFDVFGNSKLVARLVRYDTLQLRDATITPAGTADPNNGALGSTNHFNINDALYFLTTTSQNGYLATWPAGTGPGMGPMSAEEYAFFPASQRYPYGVPIQVNAAMVDVHTRGFEFSIEGKPTKNINVRFHLTYSDRSREKIFQEIFDYYNAKIPIWMEMANRTNPNSPDGIYYVNPSSTTPTTLADYIWSQLYGAGGVRVGLANNLKQQTGALGSRPWKSNLSVRYTFDKSTMFKGVSMMGTIRYQSPNLYPINDNGDDHDLESIPDQSDTHFAFDPTEYYNRIMTKGNTTLFYDAMLNYKCKIFGGRTTLLIQLNVQNILNTDKVGTGRRNPDGTLKRPYPPNPRRINFTTTLQF